MFKLFVCLSITFHIFSMEGMLSSFLPAAVSGLFNYSRGRHQATVDHEASRIEHEKLKADLSKSGLIIRGTHQAVLCNPLNTFFNRAIEDGDDASMQSILRIMRDQFDINGLDANGSTALHIASRQRNTICLHYLCAIGADPDHLDVFGMAPLHYAAQANDIEIMTALIERGADLNKKRPEDGFTPLAAALRANKQEAITFLLALKNKPAENKNEENKRVPSPDHLVSLLGPLRVALEMKNSGDHGARDSFNLIFNAFLKRNPECGICFDELPPTIYITTCCQKGVCPICAPKLTGLEAHSCPYCQTPYERRSFDALFTFYQQSPRPPSRGDTSYAASSSSS